MFSIVISVISTITSGVLVFIITNLLKENRTIRDRRRDENMRRENSISEGVLCLLRVKLIEYHDHYVALDGIPSYALSNWNMMYTAYHNLGGNGMITAMDKEIQQLKII